MPLLPRARPPQPDVSAGAPRGSVLVDCATYRDGRRLPGTQDPVVALREARTEGGFVWVGLYEPTDADLGALAAEFGLHPLAVEDAVHAHQRPKVDAYEGMTFAVFKTVSYVAHEELTATSDVVETGEVMVFLGSDYVITVRHGEHGDLQRIRQRLEDDPELLAHGPAAVLYAVADRVVDDYVAVAQAVADDVDEVESAVFGRQAGRDVERIYQLKREVLEFKRAVVPLTTPMRLLAERAPGILDTALRAYIRDVEDHLLRVQEQIGGYDELLTSVLQASLAQVQVAQNRDMRKISAWVAILAVPTMIAGIYGMNFEHMPELQWRFGYPLVLLVAALICTLLYRGFRRNGWL